MASIIVTRNWCSKADSTDKSARETDRWSRRTLLSSALGLGAATAMTGQARTQSGTSQREATPAAGSRDEEEHGLASMAAGIPLSAAEDARSDEHMYWFAYTNLLAQWEALGLDPPTSMSLDDIEVPINRVRAGMALYTGDFMNANNPEFIDDLGFQPYMVHERLLVGDSLYVFRGGLDLEALPPAWEAAGFELVTTDRGEEVWTLGPDGEEHPDNLLSRAMVGHMNNVTILDSGHVVFAPQLDQVESLLTALADGEPSLVEEPALSGILPTLPENTLSVAAMDGPTISGMPGQMNRAQMTEASSAHGESFMGVHTERLTESDDAVGPMPKLGMTVIGVTATPFRPEDDEAEAPEDAGRLFARFETSSPEEAAQAAEVSAYRWDRWTTTMSNEPYVGYGAIEQAGADDNVAVFDCAPGLLTYRWTFDVLSHNLAVFAS